MAAAHDLQHRGCRQVDRGSGERGAAAVLSPRAAALFGLEILVEEIGDLPGNRTRFLVLGAAAGAAIRRSSRARGPGAAMRTTLVMAVRNEPGTLLAALRVFAEHGLNMSELESRPSRERAWEYVFWVELDADAGGPGDGSGARATPRGDDDGSRARRLPAQRTTEP